MDPLSITVSVLTLITISAQVTGLVKQLRDEINVVDATLDGILNDVDGFQSVLESMKETVDEKDLRGDLQTTGHVGNHWKNLLRSLSDGESTLEQLRSLIISVNRSAKFLDAPRKHLRFKSAIAQIAEFREQIQSYRAALQLSLSTIILWNQSTLQKATDQIPDKVIPDLNKLYDEFRALGTTLNMKIERLQSTVANQGYHAQSELISMTNLKECVKSAADVVSTASTTLAPEASERASVKYGSDFGDVFKQESNEPMHRWISSNTVYEYEDVEAPAPDPSETSTREALTEYQSDSDSDIENELVRALFNNGKKRKQDGDLQGAARTLKNCLSRFPTTSTYSSMTSSQITSITAVPKAELLELLTETYCLQGAWGEAKIVMKEKLAITEHQTGKKSERYLWDTYKLSEVMVKTKDFAEAHLHGRQSLRGFKRLREQGLNGYEKSLSLLILICSEEGNAEEEEAYTALLESHHLNMTERYSGVELGVTVAAKEEDFPTATPHLQSAIGSPPRDLETEEAAHLQPLTESTSSRSLGATIPQQNAQAVVCQTDLSKRAEPLLSSIECASYKPGASGPTKSRIPEERKRSASAESEPSIDSPRSRPSSSPRMPSMKLPPFRPEVYDDESAPVPSLPTDTVSHSSGESKALKSQEYAAKHLSRRYGVVTEEKSSDRDPEKESVMANTKLLVALCKKEVGRKPVFMIGRGREGYSCIVTLATNTVDGDRIEEVARVTGCESREEARHAGAARAYALLTKLCQTRCETAVVNTATDKDLMPDRSSDKEFYVTPAQAKMDPPPYTPDDILSDTTSPVPEIMVSPTLDSAPFSADIASSAFHDMAIRRAASDSHLPWHKKPGTTAQATSGGHSHAGPWSTSHANLFSNPSTHRRADSTTSPPAEWTVGDDQLLAWPRQSERTDAYDISSQQKKSTAQPNVTFDAIESSVYKPVHSNLDPTTSTSRRFLSKTFSLQDRRSKSDDVNLTKKKSLRAILLPSSLARSASVKQDGTIFEPEMDSTAACPICNKSLSDLAENDRALHANDCLDRLPSQPIHEVGAAFELPGSDPSSTAVELPVPMSPQRRTTSSQTSRGSSISFANSDALSDLHRAYSKRDLYMDNFETSTPLQPTSTIYDPGTLQIPQCQILLLGDTQCGKTWLSRAWCHGAFTKALSASRNFTKVVNGTELILHDRTALEFIREHMRREFTGSTPVVLLCFDISSVESFENVERRWNYEADLYLENVPKILVGCKKDLRSEAARSVWTRDAYKMTAKVNAKAYFETSAVTNEGLGELFRHVAQMHAR